MRNWSQKWKHCNDIKRDPNRFCLMRLRLNSHSICLKNTELISCSLKRRSVWKKFTLCAKGAKTFLYFFTKKYFVNIFVFPGAKKKGLLKFLLWYNQRKSLSFFVKVFSGDFLMSLRSHRSKHHVNKDRILQNSLDIQYIWSALDRHMNQNMGMSDNQIMYSQFLFRSRIGLSVFSKSKKAETSDEAINVYFKFQIFLF